MTAKGQHVVPSGGEWSVRRSGARKATAIYATEAEAIERATAIARKEHGIIYIHDRNGHIRERRTCNKSPHPLSG